MPDPFRHQTEDVLDALDHATEGQDVDLANWIIKRDTDVPVSEVLNYDDYSSWGEWEPGELLDYDRDELREELVNFRGEEWADRALSWLDDGLPAVVVLPDTETFGGVVGDGRGRLSFAVGMGIESVPVIWVTRRPLGQLKNKLLR